MFKKKWGKKIEGKLKLTPATGNGGAPAGVGIGLCTVTVAIVVGGAALGAGDSVPMQRTVADVDVGRQDAPAADL